jgi:hypothetical protein
MLCWVLEVEAVPLAEAAVDAGAFSFPEAAVLGSLCSVIAPGMLSLRWVNGIVSIMYNMYNVCITYII